MGLVFLPVAPGPLHTQWPLPDTMVSIPAYHFVICFPSIRYSIFSILSQLWVLLTCYLALLYFLDIVLSFLTKFLFYPSQLIFKCSSRCHALFSFVYLFVIWMFFCYDCAFVLFCLFMSSSLSMFSLFVFLVHHILFFCCPSLVDKKKCLLNRTGACVMTGIIRIIVEESTGTWWWAITSEW